MAEIVPYAIWAVLIITVLSIGSIAAFGIRSVVQGKVNPLTAGLTVIPGALFLIFGLVLGNWTEGAIVAVLISLGLSSLVLLLSGLRGLFGF
ncbi:MAG: hypothetical protein O3B41_00725 [Bacteroidetes bacterium]|nr:hypothetical protein [Bacteroidota bacterium]